MCGPSHPHDPPCILPALLVELFHCLCLPPTMTLQVLRQPAGAAQCRGKSPGCLAVGPAFPAPTGETRGAAELGHGAHVCRRGDDTYPPGLACR